MVLCSLFFRVYRPNIVIGIVLMVYTPALQTYPPSDTRGYTRPDLRPKLDTPQLSSPRKLPGLASKLQTNLQLVDCVQDSEEARAGTIAIPPDLFKELQHTVVWLQGRTLHQYCTA